MYLDSFDETILKVLGEGKRGKTLREVLEETGFARSTVIIHLHRLEAKRDVIHIEDNGDSLVSI